MHNLWERIKADIHRAPLWVWLGLLGTAVLIYLAWRNGGLSGLTSSSLPTAPAVPSVDTTGNATPDTSSTTTLPLPVSPALWTSGGDTGGSGGASGGGGSSGPANGAPGNDRPTDPAGAPAARGASGATGGGIAGIAGAVGEGILGVFGLSHRPPTPQPAGRGVGTSINNPTAASQRQHRGQAAPTGRPGLSTPLRGAPVLAPGQLASGTHQARPPALHFLAE